MNLIFFTVFYVSSARALYRNTRSSMADKLTLLDQTLRVSVARYALPGRSIVANHEFQQILTFMGINNKSKPPVGKLIDEVDGISRIIQNFAALNDDTDIQLYLFMTTNQILQGIAENVYNLNEVDHSRFYLAVQKGAEYSVIREPYAGMGELDPECLYLARQIYRYYEPGIPFGGLLLTRVPVDPLRRALSAHAPTPGSLTFVVDHDGWVQLATDRSIEGTNLRHRFPNVVVDEGDIVFFTDAFNGRQSWISAIGSLQSWYIVAVTPFSEALAVLSRLTRVLIISLGVNIAISGLLSYRISREIANPIEKLVGSIRKVQQGDFSLGIDYRRNDEFSRLIQEYNHMLSRIDELMADLVTAEKEKTDAELTALQAQINPHFLYNALDTINWMALEAGEHDISEIVTRLSDFFRYSLSRGKKVIPLSDEVRQVQSYLLIQKLQYPDTFDFYIDLPPECEHYETVKLILQPLAENAIVHGFRDLDRPGMVEITVSEQPEAILIEVSDNGRGADVDRLNEALRRATRSPDHFAIQNVDARIKDRYGSDFGLHYRSNGSAGLVAVVRLPKAREGGA